MKIRTNVYRWKHEWKGVFLSFLYLNFSNCVFISLLFFFCKIIYLYFHFLILATLQQNLDNYCEPAVDSVVRYYA